MTEPDTSWLSKVAAGLWQVVPTDEWRDGTSLMICAPGLRIATGDNPARGTLCAGCDLPIGGLPFEMWTLIGPHPCDRGGSHLISVTALLHATCMISDHAKRAASIRARTADCFDQ